MEIFLYLSLVCYIIGIPMLLVCLFMIGRNIILEKRETKQEEEAIEEINEKKYHYDISEMKERFPDIDYSKVIFTECPYFLYDIKNECFVKNDTKVVIKDGELKEIKDDNVFLGECKTYNIVEDIKTINNSSRIFLCNIINKHDSEYPNRCRLVLVN
jgi:hypothetical protein